MSKREEIVELKGTVDTLDQIVDDIDTSVTVLTNQMGGVKGDIKKVDAKVDRLARHLSDHQHYEVPTPFIKVIGMRQLYNTGGWECDKCRGPIRHTSERLQNGELQVHVYCLSCGWVRAIPEGTFHRPTHPRMEWPA